MPNLIELESILSLGQGGLISPALPSGHPFSGVQITSYWSSFTNVSSTSNAWVVNLGDGSGDMPLVLTDKGIIYYVWPMRGGQ
ncbi:MAG: DUF1566 domain-containing protein [Magnetococcus sp. DMHC-1]